MSDHRKEHDLWQHIEKQDKKIEQLKIHLDTYAEVIGKRQQEVAGLRERVAELDLECEG